MSYLQYAVERLLFAVLSVYVVVTVMFFTVSVTVWALLGGRIADAQRGGAKPGEIPAIKRQFYSQREVGRPLLDRYVDWLIDVPTLDWGYSPAYRESVVAVLDGRVQTTLGYVLPGVAVAVLLGVGLGVYAALEQDGALDWGSRLVAYGLFGVPAFIPPAVVSFLYGGDVTFYGGATQIPPWLVWPLACFTVAAAVFAGQIRFARTAALEQTGRAFVKMLRAKGVSRLGYGRHVLRNASLQVVSLSISELLSVMVLTIYVVETALPIDGLASASLRAVDGRDVSLVIWSTLVIVFIGIGANVLKDLLYGYLDPRIRAE